MALQSEMRRHGSTPHSIRGRGYVCFSHHCSWRRWSRSSQLGGDAQTPGISLVNKSSNEVKRRKDGEFIARPVFDRQLAFLAYAVRDPDTGDWLTGVTQVRGGEKKLSSGWEYTWEYPAYSKQPSLDPERVYVPFMMGA